MTEAAWKAIGRARATYKKLQEEYAAKAPTEDLSSRAETMLRLVELLATLITLERLAYGIDPGGDEATLRELRQFESLIKNSKEIKYGSTRR
jgi:hypothetical protein